MAQPIRLPTADERPVLDQISVRPIQPEEQPRWDALVTAHDYLRHATLMGEHLRDVVEYQGRWLALIGWAAPARHQAPREAWIG